MKNVDEIYAAMVGEAIVPREGVTNEYAPGGYCDQLYNTAWEARKRLIDRIGSEAEADLDVIFSCLNDITYYLCNRIYEYGATQ